ncbi:unnamed protein product, partial [Amoebophrya sp. A25]
IKENEAKKSVEKGSGPAGEDVEGVKTSPAQRTAKKSSGETYSDKAASPMEELDFRRTDLPLRPYFPVEQNDEGN